MFGCAAAARGVIIDIGHRIVPCQDNVGSGVDREVGLGRLNIDPAVHLVGNGLDDVELVVAGCPRMRL